MPLRTWPAGPSYERAGRHHRDARAFFFCGLVGSGLGLGAFVAFARFEGGASASVLTRAFFFALATPSSGGRWGP